MENKIIFSGNWKKKDFIELIEKNESALSYATDAFIYIKFGSKDKHAVKIAQQTLDYIHSSIGLNDYDAKMWEIDRLDQLIGNIK